MADYRIVCTEQEPVYLPTRHAHIVAVGTGTDPANAAQRWILAEVVNAILSRVHSFFTYSPSTGRWARVLVENCPSCGHQIIRSSPDRVTDNNLDSLRRCNWTS